MTYNFKDVKVLVVESTPPMYTLIEGVLSMFTVPPKNISAAYSVEEAYESFKQHEQDLLIVDWLDQPDKGLKLTKRIRTDPASPNPFVPIIMTAGSGHLKKVLRARDHGISEYLVKPFTAMSLADRITRVIEKPRLYVMSEAYTGPDRRVSTQAYDGPERRQHQAAPVKIQFGGDEPAKEESKDTKLHF